ncbi:hypothetical protein [Mesorhizobium waimense]|uniref:hypothetical protein n=1 Tax=Mesorhizobium waimense TaxID=1300307 RepID=UPI0011C34595|nr:hypothetical protein [Mesorhizobium waimense]
MGSQKYGEAIEIPWGEVRSSPWIGSAFAQTNLVRTAWLLRQGQLYMPGRKATISLPIGTIEEIGILGPDRRDIADGFTLSSSRTPYPVFWGHSADEVRRIGAAPNKWLSPRPVAAKGRSLRDVAVLWQRGDGHDS